jgi:hypothetical protein
MNLSRHEAKEFLRIYKNRRGEMVGANVTDNPTGPRETMNAVLLFVFIASIAFMVLMMVWACSRSRQILDDWARRNGYQIIKSKHRLFRIIGPFLWTCNEFVLHQEVYFVTVRTPEGEIRRGWVLCGNWFLGILINSAQVRWEK